MQSIFAYKVFKADQFYLKNSFQTMNRLWKHFMDIISSAAELHLSNLVLCYGLIILRKN